ncbi:MAG: FecR domain-containing protein [Cyclobacteriaceae bacterium]
MKKYKWLLIQRFVTGNAKSEEHRIVEEWMDQHPDNKFLIRELEEIWALSSAEDFEVNIQEAWKKFKTSDIKSKSRPILYHYRKKSRSAGIIINAFRVAAFILVAFVAGYFSHQMTAVINEAEQVGDRSGFYSMQEMTTDRGEKARVTFSDGTEVMLNSASSLQFPDEFHGSIRKVHLQGEAFFKVVNNPDQPFIVNVDGAEVKVLGTAFNVRSWSDDSSTEVMVREGKVSVSSTALKMEEPTEVVLTEGYYTRLAKGKVPAPAKKVDPTNYLLWTSGGMHFNNDPIAKVITDIERRFNVDISVVGDDLVEIPYTGTFQYAELDEVLSVIAASVGFEYSREGKEIEFLYDPDLTPIELDQ